MTYGELDALSDRLAAGLQASGIGPATRWRCSCPTSRSS